MNTRFLISAALALTLATPPAHADGRAHRAGGGAPTAEAEAPLDALAVANEDARQRPSRSRFEHARQVYEYQPGALFVVYANPQYVSTILLERGERLFNIAAGDTSRWMVTQAEGDDQGGTIVLIKPQAANLRTNIVLITDRRTYLVEAISQTGPAYSAQIAWSYPRSEQSNPTPWIANLNFNYRIRAARGARPAWTPARVFDDGRRTWIEFAPTVAASDLPPLFVITPDGAELVNYRVQSGSPGQRYMLDRIFNVAELRLGTHAQTIVRIERNPEEQARPSIHHGPRA